LQELGGFEVDPNETRAMWEEAIEVIIKAWEQETFEHHGQHYNIPPSSLVPKPLQKPHPPLWLAGTNPDSFGTAGQRGLGILGFVTGRPEDVGQRVKAYKDGIRQAKPMGRYVNDQCAVLIQTYCAPTREQAVADVTTPLEIVARLSAKLYLPWAEKPAEQVAESYRYLTQRPAGSTRAGAAAGGVAERAADGMIAVGTPDDLIRLFRTYQAMGVDQMLMWVQFGGLEHAKIMQSLDLIGKHVLPELAKA
jgi:alkanesulfonate monooxygenase SsuD/methylene tetrahydromethanopterin reductase-like flavin-dependent oxidoreductase (luciferase family)